jgi:hypothetical protein
MTRYEIPIVFDVEADPPEPLGVYLRNDEDAVLYTPYGAAAPGETYGVAPDDCVRVATCVVIVP